MPETTKKVLIIEDEAPLQEALAAKCLKEGLTVLKAKNGVEGYEMAVAEKPDLIILDIVMPKMDGLTSLDKIRSENVYGQNVPVIILTNLPADDKILQRVTKTAPTYYLVKSQVPIADIMERVREVLGL